MPKKNKLIDKDFMLLDKLAKDCYSYLPFENYQGYMTLMSDIVNSWPKRNLTSSNQTTQATTFGYYIGFLSSQMFMADITKERKIIKNFLKADKDAQERLKEKLEKEILQPDYSTGI